MAKKGKKKTPGSKLDKKGKKKKVSLPELTLDERAEVALMKRHLKKLRVDLSVAARTLDKGQVRYLVDTYYQLQEVRKRASNQDRAQEESQEPNVFVSAVAAVFRGLENEIKAAMGEYADSTITGRWMQGLYGFGPVLTAGLLAHVDITRAPTAGHIWSFAGVNPSKVWEKGKKRPYNARLKVLVWKIGQCILKFSGDDRSYYGPLWRDYKKKLVGKNELKAFEEAAKANLAKLKNTETVTYKKNSKGYLSDGHINDRANRWAAKLFLSHFHEVLYREHYGKLGPKPFVLAFPEKAGGQHVHYIAPPAWPFPEDWDALIAARLPA